MLLSAAKNIKQVVIFKFEHSEKSACYSYCYLFQEFCTTA